MKPGNNSIGIGTSKEFSLRISVAAIVAVKFIDPENKNAVLALERTATTQIKDEKPVVIVKAKPFGGGVRLLDPERLKYLIGGFNYDSDRSAHEKDFRILADPGSWKKIKEICKNHLNQTDYSILETGPEREMEEEFEDSLKIKIKPDDYSLLQKGLLFEDLPENTGNIHARSLPTVRVYYLYDAQINNVHIIDSILSNSREYSDNDLAEMALVDYSRGRKGRANGVLALDPDKLKDFFDSVPSFKRNGSLPFEGHQLDGNVIALFEEISNFKYKRY